LHTYCSNSVYIINCNISILRVKKRDFIGFFSAFAHPRFWFNCCAVQNLLEIIRKDEKTKATAYHLIKIFFESLPDSFTEVIGGAEDFARFGAFGRAYEAFALHHV
jgi:hypothetical protein